MTLIGVTGFAQHGKDTLAHVLVEDYGFMQMSFAGPLKDLAYRLSPYVVEGFKDGEWKPTRLAALVDDIGWEAAKQYPEVRRTLQVLGTEARNLIDQDVWVHAAANLLSQVALQPLDVVFSDVRFPNEAEFIKAWGGKIIAVHRPDFDNGVDSTVESERHVPDLPADLLIVNDHETVESYRNVLVSVLGGWLGEAPVWASNA